MRRHWSDPGPRACGLCREREADADSHVFPKAMCRKLAPKGTGSLQMIPSDPTDPTEDRPTGPHDGRILCRSCESRHQRYDDHAAKVLTPVPIVYDPRAPLSAVLRGTDWEAADGPKLKLFFMHILWRAHQSTLPDFVATDLGERGEALRELLLGDDPGGDDDFALLLVWFPPDAMGMHQTAVVPHAGEWVNGSTFYRLKIGHWLATITTSPGGMPPELRPFTVGRPGPAVLVAVADRPFSETDLFEFMLEAVRQRVALE